MAVATGKTAAWAKVGRACLYISAQTPPSDADWQEYLKWLAAAGKPNAANPEVISLVYERSAGPTPSQRKQLNDVTSGWKLRVAVMTPSALVRGMVTAMNWFKKDSYEAFPLEQLDAAITYLQTPPNLVAEVKGTVFGLIKDLDKP